MLLIYGLCIKRIKTWFVIIIWSKLQVMVYSTAANTKTNHLNPLYWFLNRESYFHIFTKGYSCSLEKKDTEILELWN